MKPITTKQLRSILHPRTSDSHKGTYGHSLLVAGNVGKMGAAVIAARACLRSGTGLLTVCVPMEERLAIHATVPESMVVFREQAIPVHSFSAIGVGPGIGTSGREKKLLKNILQQASCPLVLDADALNLVAADPKLKAMLPPGSILTPHPKEFDRLFGTHDTEDARSRTAIEQATRHQLVMVLKGHHTLVTSGSETCFNTTGNAGLAKGGSGDALTGMITALLAQGYKPFEAAIAAVYLHGHAADLTLHQQSMESMLISDVIENIGLAFQSVRK